MVFFTGTSMIILSLLLSADRYICMLWENHKTSSKNAGGTTHQDISKGCHNVLTLSTLTKASYMSNSDISMDLEQCQFQIQMLQLNPLSGLQAQCRFST